MSSDKPLETKDDQRDPRDYLTHYKRIIAFNRTLVAVTGSITAALMLSQMIYLTTEADDPDAWLYQSREEWFYYTGMSRYEQEGARKILRNKTRPGGALIEERWAGMPAMCQFRINHENLRQALANVTLPKKPKHRSSDGGKPANKMAENQPTAVGGKPANKMAENQPTRWRKTSHVLNKEKVLKESTKEKTPSPTVPTPPTTSQEGEGTKPCGTSFSNHPYPETGPGDLPALAQLIVMAHPLSVYRQTSEIPGTLIALVRERIRDEARLAQTNQTDAATMILSKVNELAEGIGNCPHRLPYVPNLERFFGKERCYRRDVKFYTREGVNDGQRKSAFDRAFS